MAGYSYQERLAALHERKVEQTREKRCRSGFMDEDDYGCVPPPEDFHFEPIWNDEVNHTFYGAKLWGLNFRHLMEAHPVYVDVNDALAGRWMFILQRMRPFESVTSAHNMEMAPIFDYSDLKEVQEKYALLPGIGKMHHFGGDYQIGLDLGWKGLLEKVERCDADPHRAGDEEAHELYAAEKDVLLGIINWVGRTIDEIRRMEEAQEDPLKRENLRKMREANEQILAHPARDLREACQWIAWYNMAERTYCRAGAGCQLDTLLYPYYRKSREDGMSEEEARFILSCFLLNDPHYYQIGGPAADGSDNTNELSYLILEAANDIKVTNNITIRVFEGMDERLMRRGMEILFENRQGFPRFSGDKALVSGFMKNGYPAELARRRIALGCNWMSLPGLEYTMNDLIKVNMAKVFEVAYSTYEGESTQELWEVFCSCLTEAVSCLKAGIDFHLKHQYQNAPELLLNLVSHGPIEKGRDASHGGMTYYNIAIDGAGLAVVADSFAALRQVCEEEKRFTWQEVKEAVADDFGVISGDTGRGEVTRRVLSSVPMYGSGGSDADTWAIRVSRQFTQEVAGSRTPDGYLTIPGLFSWANTIPFGKDVGATPNGRHAHRPINHGANPNNGFRRDGAFTAAARAIASVQPGYGNTAPFQLELNDSLIRREGAVDAVMAVIRGHFDLGGTLVNVNIVDADEIRRANEDPDSYPDLIVRVTGFTAYFCVLSDEFRQLVVDRIMEPA